MTNVQHPRASSAELREKVNGTVAHRDTPEDRLIAQERALIGRINAMTGEFGKALSPTAQLPVELIVRDAITAVRGNKKLATCSYMSVLGAVMSAVQLGLRLGTLNQAWLVPYEDRSNNDITMRGLHAKLIIGYQGFLELAYRSGYVAEVSSEVVYQREFENGKFRFHRTETGPHLFHEPDIDIVNPNEQIYAFYAVGRTVNGGYHVTRPWGAKRMLVHRDSYAPRDRDGQIPAGNPWVKHYPEMARKTMFLRLVKYLPKSTELNHALHADGGVRFNQGTSVMPADVTERANGAEVVDADAVVDVSAAAETNHAVGDTERSWHG